MLEDNLVKLRALEIADADLLYIWENDPEQWRVSNTITPFSRQVLIEYITSIRDIYTDKQLRLIMMRKSDGVALGTVDFFDVDFKNKRAGIGILVAEQVHRQKGWASRAIRLCCTYAKQVLDLHQLYCNILSDNSGSIALFKKFGFLQIGLKKDWNLHSGAYYDELLLQKILQDGQEA